MMSSIRRCINCDKEFENKGNTSCSSKCVGEYIKKLEQLNGPLLKVIK